MLSVYFKINLWIFYRRYNFHSFEMKPVSRYSSVYCKNLSLKIIIFRLKNNSCQIYKLYNLTKHRWYDNHSIVDSKNLPRHGNYNNWTFIHAIHLWSRELKENKKKRESMETKWTEPVKDGYS